MKHCVVGVLCFLFHLSGHSQSRNYTGLCAYSKLHADAFSFTMQPAALARLQSRGIGFLGERKFLLPELSSAEVVVTIPTYAGNFACSATNTGTGAYRRWETALNYARRVGSRVDIGVSFACSRSGAAGYNKSNEINGGIGMLIQLTEKLATGFFAETVFNGDGNQKGRMSIYKIGLGYDASELVHLAIHIIKEDNYPATLMLGIHYRIINKLWMRAGISSAEAGWWMGAGMTWKKLRLDLISNYHPALGASPALLLFIPINSKK